MNQHCVRRTYFALFAGFLLVISLSASAANAQGRGQLSGLVTDGMTDWTSSPVEGATVRLYSLDRILQTKSDKAGRFELTNLPAGNYEMEVVASGFKIKSIKEIKVTWDSELHYDIALDIGVACAPIDSVSYESVKFDAPNLRGVVVDADASKRPLSNVEVRLFHVDKTPQYQRTDERGQFSFTISTPGRYFLQTLRPGYQTMTSQQFWIVRRGRTVVNMRQLKVGMMIVCE